jgi:hypothetical protein
MADLSPSPAAQAVIDAMYEVNMDFGDENDKLGAAVLRAAAPLIECVQDHSKLLALAAEMEGSNV